MIGPQVQKAIKGALATASVAGGRIYDRPPADPVFPYLTIGDEQVINDGGSDSDQTCRDGWEVISDVHVWSRPKTGDKAVLKQTVATVTTTIIAITSIDDFDLISINLENSNSNRGSDGNTEHAILSFRFVIQPES